MGDGDQHDLAAEQRTRSAALRAEIGAVQARSVGSIDRAAQLCERSTVLVARLTRQRQALRLRRRMIGRQRMRVRAAMERARGVPPADVGVAPVAITLDTARQLAGWSLTDLWVGYFVLGGDRSAEELGEILAGLAPLDAMDHARLAVVLNEHFADLGLGRPIDLPERCSP